MEDWPALQAPTAGTCSTRSMGQRGEKGWEDGALSFILKKKGGEETLRRCRAALPGCSEAGRLATHPQSLGTAEGTRVL